MMKYFFTLLCVAMCHLTVMAQEESQADSSAVVTNSFWDNWYGQLGVDMNLLFPYGHSVKDVFPNGKSFGINAAVGKWFSPEFGGRFKVTWNNGILSNDYNTWLAPYGKAGQNHREGGFVTFIGDILLNLHNLFGEYEPDRKWNLSVGPRVGGYLNIGNGYIAGAHILGFGAVNTFRLSDRWRLFADIGYHFVSSINGVRSGHDHGSNGFAEINLGVEMDLSRENKFHKASSYKKNSESKKGVTINSFWDNWFVQAGLGMSLQNPYSTNFANVFPNGSTYGLNVGLGKWFTHEVGARGGLNWQNGIVVNHHAAYLAPGENSEGDPNKHSFIALYADMLFNLHNMIGGYDAYRKWNTIVYPRMGLAKNFAADFEECPIMGLGAEQTYKVNDKIKLYADVAYQVTTGGFLDGKFDTGRDGSNGWFDINVGVQYELGQTIGWNKPGEKHLAKTVGGHNWPRFIVNTGASVVVAFGVKTALKAMIKEERPDHSDNKSFPSGHAAMAFAAARSIDKEFRKDCIWIPIAGYAAATAIGIERIANKHHHWYDVVAGAGLGFGAAELTWWLSDKMFGKGSNVAVGSSGNTVDVVYNF